MTIEREFCIAHARWSHEQGGGGTKHAFDHTSGPKRDYCFWCGRHRSGDGRFRADSGTFTDDDWWNDAIQFGVREP